MNTRRLHVGLLWEEHYHNWQLIIFKSRQPACGDGLRCIEGLLHAGERDKKIQLKCREQVFIAL